MLKHYNIFFGNPANANTPFIKLHDCDISFEMGDIKSISFCNVATPDSYPNEGPCYNFISCEDIELQAMKSKYEEKIKDLEYVMECMQKNIDYFKGLSELS